MSESANAINVYTCEKCRFATVTITSVTGTTPFTIRCRSCNGAACDGTAMSAFYRVPQDGSLLPLWEWYSPDTQERIKLDRDTLEHVDRGGLLLRRLDSSGREIRYPHLPKSRHG